MRELQFVAIEHDAVISTHGEIFTVATDRGEEQRVTETPWRDEDPKWAPNGKVIAFISDRSGREEIWTSDELGHEAKQISDADCEKNDIEWAPDSKSLLWTGSDHTLRRVKLDGGDTEVLATSNAGPIGSPTFSPDGKWISYSKQDIASCRSRVFLNTLDGGLEHVIDSDPIYPSRRLARGRRMGRRSSCWASVLARPAMSSLNRTTYQLYSIALQPVTKAPDDRDVNTEADAANAPAGRRGGGRGGRGGFGGGRGGGGGAGGNADGGGADGGADAPARGEVRIEWNGLEKRVTQLTPPTAGSVSSIIPSPNGTTIAFVAFGDDGGPGIFTINEDGSGMRRVNGTPAADPAGGGAPRRGRGGRGGFGGGGFGEPQWTRDGRSIYSLQGGGIYSVSRYSVVVAGAVYGSRGSPAGGWVWTPRARRRRRICRGGCVAESPVAERRRRGLTSLSAWRSILLLSGDRSSRNPGGSRRAASMTRMMHGGRWAGARNV